ncbi:MAG: hypothetical protein ACRC0O_09210, partial [Vibrio metschnikovii]
GRTKMGVSRRCHRRTIFGSLKNCFVKGSLKDHFILTILLSKEPFYATKNLLCNEKVLWILMVLHGTIHPAKEPLFLRE